VGRNFYSTKGNPKQRYFGKTLVLLVGAFVMGMMIQKKITCPNQAPESMEASTQQTMALLRKLPQQQESGSDGRSSSSSHVATNPTATTIPYEFRDLYERALLHSRHCTNLGLLDHPHESVVSNNNHTAHLAQFGILQAFADPTIFDSTTNQYPYTCQLPPEQECDETQFTVVFMAYNPDRLQKLYNQILKMVSDPDFAPLVREVLIVWNGSRQVEETKLGESVVHLGLTKPVRISYPLQAGFPNDLMNRYHPRLDIKTKAIMYYDDDGPFYSFQATIAGFELWKRNANAQIGAMARKLDLGPRQVDEKTAILNGPGDRFFVSHCPTDEVRYNFNEFANFGANMVLPSGSFLHSNYLCFLWHPLFAEIRSYVQKHPVNPDDGTVSVIVSQLAGRAPKVYSRRISDAKNDNGTSEGQQQRRRRLMDGIDWDNNAQAADKKNMWGRLRSDAANSLVRYFGSMNSGSIGWCYETPYQQGGYCKPEMAKVGYLPWMKPDHTPRDSCP
jgi:hypothetical protein